MCQCHSTKSLLLLMGALFHRSKVTRRSQFSCFELESRRTHCCLLETFATVFLDSILAALDSTQYHLILTFVFVICSTTKEKPSTTSQCSEKRSLKERIQSDSNMIQWYNTSYLTHGTFFWDHLSIGRVSFNVVKSIFLRCLSDVTSPHHTRGPSFAVFRVTLFFFMHFILVCTKLCLLGRWRSSPPRHEAEFNQKIDAH